MTRARFVCALALLFALSTGARATAQETDGVDESAPTDEVEDARRLFGDGMRELEAGRPTVAAELFEASLARSARPATAFNLGLALRDAGRHRDAWSVAERLLDDAYGALDVARRPEVERLRDEVLAGLAALEVLLEGASRARLTIDGTFESDLVEGAPHATALEPGPHDLVAAVTDGPALQQRIDLTAGERARVLLNVTSGVATVDSEHVGGAESGSVTPWLWVGLGAALLAAAAVVLVVALTADASQPTIDDVYGRTETLRF